MKHQPKISEAELEIMSLLWEHGEPMTAAQICEELMTKLDWGQSTVKTLLSRLCQKNAITRSKAAGGGVYSYTPLITQREYGRESADRLIGKIFGGSAKDLVASLFEDDKLTEEDINELKALWDDRQKEN